VSPDRLVRVGDLVLQKDIVERLGLNPTAVANLASERRRCGFPRPIIGRGSRGIWLWPEVESWYEQEMPKTVEGRRAAEKAARLTDRSSKSRVRRTN
jgi:hypothetical protein